MTARRWGSLVIRAGITVALAAYVASKVDLSLLGQRLLDVRGTWLLAALGVLALQVGLAAARWDRVIAALHGSLGFALCLRYTWEGLFFSQVLPSSVGGDVVKAFRVHRAGLLPGVAAATVLLDRLAALATVLLCVAFSIPALSEMVRIRGFAEAVTTLLGIGILGFGFLFAMDRLLMLPATWRITRFLHRLAVDLRSLLLRPHRVAAILGYSLMILVLSALSLYLLGRSLDIAFAITHALVFTPLILLLMTLPISIAGWGIRELGMVVLLEQVGVAQTDAAALSVAFGLALLIVALPGALVWTVHSRSSFSSGGGADGARPKQDPT